MGAGVSHDEAEKYLNRQEQLIEKLSAAVAARKQQQQQEGSGNSIPSNGDGRPAWLVAQQNDFANAANTNAATGEVPTALYDEFYGLLERARAAERRRIEPPVEPYEIQLPNAEWQAPTEDEAAALRDSRPWLAVMNKPSGFQYGGGSDEKPAVTLELEHVYGYRSSGVRNNLRWTSATPNGQGVLFFAGAVAVVHDVLSNTQTFFQEHQDEITALAVSKDGTLVATGDQGKYPCIYIWDVESKKVRAKLSGGMLRRAVASLAFSDDGFFLAAVGLDDENSITVYDWKRGRALGESATSARRILEVVPNRETATKAAFPFLTVGEAGTAMWWGVGGKQLFQVPLQLGSMGEAQTFPTALSTAEWTAIGTENGELYLTQHHKLLRVLDAHHGAVLSLSSNASGSILVSGGYDGYVSQWSAENGFRRLSSVVMPSTLPSASKNGVDASSSSVTFSRPNSIRAVDALTNPITGAVDALVVGTVSGGVFEVTSSLKRRASFTAANAAGPAGSKPPVQITPLLVAHGGDLSTASVVGELTGLATHPTEALFVSVGETTLIRWNANTRSATHTFRLPSRGQCVAWGPNEHIVVGLHSGVFLIFTKELVLVKEIRASLRRVQCLRFSNDGTVLAVGTADNAIHLYDASSSTYELGGKLTGGGGVPLSIDFSVDGSLLQVSNQLYELVYFDVRSMKQIEGDAAQAASNIPWATFSSLLGWTVQGIWPLGSELNDVSNVCRSHATHASSAEQLIATAEESGLVKVFRYPCVGGGIDYKDGALHKRPDAVRGSGHGGKVTQVQWLADDTKLISTGGEDLSCFQWRVVRN